MLLAAATRQQPIEIYTTCVATDAAEVVLMMLMQDVVADAVEASRSLAVTRLPAEISFPVAGAESAAVKERPLLYLSSSRPPLVSALD